MPELVDGACLLENAAPVGVYEEIHQWPWQPVAQCERYSGYLIRGPSCSPETANGSEQDSDCEPDREPVPDPGHAPGNEPKYGPGHHPYWGGKYDSSSAICKKRCRGTCGGHGFERISSLIEQPGQDHDHDPNQNPEHAHPAATFGPNSVPDRVPGNRNDDPAAAPRPARYCVWAVASGPRELGSASQWETRNPATTPATTPTRTPAMDRHRTGHDPNQNTCRYSDYDPIKDSGYEGEAGYS